MPSDQHNSTMAKAMHLNFSLAWEASFGLPQYVQCMASWTYQSPPLCSIHSKKCQFGGYTWWLHFVIENCSYIFHTGYFDYTVAFQILLNSYWLVTGQTQLTMKHNGYLTLQMIIDILGCAMPGFTSHNNYFQKVYKLVYYCKKSNQSRDIV